jgi:hypothetical protein
MSYQRNATPLIIRGQDEANYTTLNRIQHGESGFDERWFQERLFQFPGLLPATEVESAFDELKAVAMELPVGGGDCADLLLVNRDGYIAVVETKLFTNPEARRAVVAQVIDYASRMSGWDYEELVNAVKRAEKVAEHLTGDDPLLEVVRGADKTFDAAEFRRKIARNLQLGRMLLLIVGDDIRDEVERMVQYIHRTPHLHFTLGLIELALFRENACDTGWLLVQPRVVAQTRLEVRSVVQITVPGEARFKTELVKEEVTRLARTSISEQQFYEELSHVSLTAADLVRWALTEASNHQLRVDWGGGGPILKYRDEHLGEDFSFGQLWKNGEFDPTYLLWKFRRLHLPEDIARDYLNDIVRVVPNSSRVECNFDKEIKTEYIVHPEGIGTDKTLPLTKLAPVKEKWFEAIDKAIRRIQQLSQVTAAGASSAPLLRRAAQ